jgi:serine/threonine protein kinase
MANMTAEQPELPEGTRLLDRYTILDRVGGGGMASIYRAMDDRLDRVVCVKLLRLELQQADGSSEGAIYRATYSHFLREALALSKLQHPNTLRIYDFGYMEDGGRPFQISEFLDAGNLEQHLRSRGAFAPNETLDILERMTGAVAEAHEQKIIHRDIKPSNILFSRVGERLLPKLADFGIAQSNWRKREGPGKGHEEGDSVSSIALFSPRWAAPEQLAGTPEGPYTDVYGLALVTAYMLSGRAPFEGPDVKQTFQERVRGDDLIASRLTLSGISGDLQRVLLRSLAADPGQRVHNPLTLFEELRHVLGGGPSIVPPAGPARKPVESVTLSVETDSPRDPEPQLVSPPERSQTLGGRLVRVVEVHERLELTLGGPGGVDVRFRVSIAPMTEGKFHINIKGMNCFVQRADGVSRPTPAIHASEDGMVDFVSTMREFLGRIAWSFGTPGPGGGRVFQVSGGELVVPSSEATYSVALDLGRGHEVIVMCKR